LALDTKKIADGALSQYDSDTDRDKKERRKKDKVRCPPASTATNRTRHDAGRRRTSRFRQISGSFKFDPELLIVKDSTLTTRTF